MSTPDTSTHHGQGPSLNQPHTKPYSELAAELPDPIAPEFSPPPDIAGDVTIPGEHIPPDQLPWNNANLDWRAWRSKYMTIASLYVLASRVSQASSDTPDGDSDDTDPRPATHLMYSPPQDAITEVSDIDKWRDIAVEQAQDVGIDGGMIAFHGFRVHPSVSKQMDRYLSGTELTDTATDVLEWEWIRQDMWRKYIRWGPHYHIIGVGSYDVPHRGVGIVKELREFPSYELGDNENGLEAISEHRAVAKDTMDHVTFAPGTSDPPMRWFGSLDGERPGAAKQLLSDAQINMIREQLINGSPHE